MGHYLARLQDKHSLHFSRRLMPKQPCEKLEAHQAAHTSQGHYFRLSTTNRRTGGQAGERGDDKTRPELKEEIHKNTVRRYDSLRRAEFDEQRDVRKSDFVRDHHSFTRAEGPGGCHQRFSISNQSHSETCAGIHDPPSNPFERTMPHEPANEFRYGAVGNGIQARQMQELRPYTKSEFMQIWMQLRLWVESIWEETFANWNTRVTLVHSCS